MPARSALKKYTQADLDEARAEIPPLVGMPDMAGMFGLKIVSVHQWRIRGVLPEPVFVVGKSPVWRLEDIQKWAKDTGREIVGPYQALQG